MKIDFETERTNSKLGFRTRYTVVFVKLLHIWEYGHSYNWFGNILVVTDIAQKT